MKKSSTRQVIEATLIVAAFMILTTLLGDWIISRDIDIVVQMAATVIWFLGTIELGKLFVKLFKS